MFENRVQTIKTSVLTPSKLLIEKKIVIILIIIINIYKLKTQLRARKQK
jgi:hypothetical protein